MNGILRFLPAFALLLGVSAASAQDVLTLGTGSAPAGGVVSIPVSVLDRTGTALGSDAGTGKRIQALALRVLFPTESVASVSFARGGVAAPLTPLYEKSLSGSEWSTYLGSFSETASVIPFTPNGPAPGDIVGTLTVTLKPQAIAGSTVVLRLDPPGAVLSSQSDSMTETVAAGNLALVNGSVTVAPPAPGGLVATAITISRVDLSWGAATSADHYEIWRSVDGGASTMTTTAPGTSISDMTVVAGKTYLYRVRAVGASGAMSAFSNLDPATTILFTDDPLVAGSTVAKAIHLTELRSAVSAFRVSAGLTALPSDPTIAAGLPVKAVHVTDLRTALDLARSTIGLAALSYTDPAFTAGVTPIRSAHMTELRNGVK